MGGISASWLPLIGGTLTGTLAVTPATVTLSGSAAAPANSALYGSVESVGGSYSGTQPSAVFTNFINSFAVNNTTHRMGYNTRVYTNLGGSNQRGGFTNFDSTVFVNAATGNFSNSFYQSVNIGCAASVNDGGITSARLGSLFGNGVSSKLLTGATFWVQNIGQETDISIQTGASAWYSGGNSVVLVADNAVAADRENFGFLVSAQLGAAPTIDLAYGIGGYQGFNPLSSTAALMEWRSNGGGLTGGPKIDRGVSLTGFTFTGNAFASTNYSVDGSGNAICATIKTPGVAVANLPAAATAGAGTRAFVTDATASTFAATVTGGGAIKVPVYSDGAAWKIG